MSRYGGRRGAERGNRVTLARAISKLGHASRAEARILVADGRVRVDGQTATDPDVWVDPAGQRIEVDGRQIRAADRVYLMLNKPRGLVTTTSDERGRATVFECLQDAALPRVVPVGRLDMESEGLLLFTNDTRWGDRIVDPRTHVDKVYHVRLERPADEALLRRMVEGVETGTGETLAAKRARFLPGEPAGHGIEVVLDEGKNRQIRRILDALGAPVARLVRVAIGPLALDGLAPGEWRHLTAAERDALSERR